MANGRSGPRAEWFEVDDDGPFDAEAFRAYLAAEEARRLRPRPRADLTSVGFTGRTIVRGIRAYQRELSSRLARQCVFEPSCSTYAELAIARNGVFRGTWETWHRLRRCHPENEGKTDYPRGVSSALPSGPDR
jgi:uncharacterized protein